MLGNGYTCGCDAVVKSELAGFVLCGANTQITSVSPVYIIHQSAEWLPPTPPVALPLGQGVIPVNVLAGNSFVYK